MAAVEHLPVHHHSADYIFPDLLGSLGSAEAAEGDCQCCTFILLHIKRLNKTEFAISVSLMCSLLPKDLYSELIYFQYT